MSVQFFYINQTPTPMSEPDVEVFLRKLDRQCQNLTSVRISDSLDRRWSNAGPAFHPDGRQTLTLMLS